MEFTSFVTLIREEVEKRAGKNYTVRLNDVRKNNGVVLSGLTVMQDDSNISPTIYLNHYYKAYEEGRVTLRYVVNDVMDIYNRNRVNRSVDMRYLLNYENVKGSIIYKLVNTDQNKEILKEIPHIEFLDLSILFQCLIEKEEYGIASILVHNTHLKLWDVSLEELYQTAKNNTPRLLEYEIKSLRETISEIVQEEAIQEMDCEWCVEEMKESIPMYVLSNKNKVEGATCILYPELIQDFASAVGSSLYIIPSSIHEVLLLPTIDDIECSKIKEMIRQINDTQVKTEEVLSYSLYFFDKDRAKMVLL